MTREAILNTIYKLSFSQGFYGRLYKALTSGSDEAEEYLDYLVEQNFGDAVALILFIEG